MVKPTLADLITDWNITQREFAARAGILDTRLTQILSGRTSAGIGARNKILSQVERMTGQAAMEDYFEVHRPDKTFKIGMRVQILDFASIPRIFRGAKGRITEDWLDGWYSIQIIRAGKGLKSLLAKKARGLIGHFTTGQIRKV